MTDDHATATTAARTFERRRNRVLGRFIIERDLFTSANRAYRDERATVERAVGRARVIEVAPTEMAIRVTFEIRQRVTAID